MNTRELKTCIFLLLLLITSITPSFSAEKISVQLAWTHQFQFAGYYAALHKGYYRQSGLDVTIHEGGAGKFAREEVLNGRAQYGVAGSELLLHRKDGEPFVVLAPIFQHSPSILLTRMDSGISNLQDFIAKKVMLLPGKKDADILVALLNEGISPDAYERQDQTYDLTDLIEGRTDAVSAYVTNEPWLLLQAGVEPMVISPQVYGVDFYSDCLFTSEDEIEKHPRRVQKFLKATLLGWEYAMAHPEEIIDLLLSKYEVKKKREHLQYEASSMEKIMLPSLVEIGHMNPGRWHHIAATYQKLGLIDADFSLEGFLYDPRPEPDYKWFKKIAFAGFAVIVLFGMGSGILFFFNRKLAAEIEERKQAEKELALQKEKAERYLHVASVMFIGLDADGRVNLANEKACQILECAKEEIIGQDWFDSFIPETVRNDVRSLFYQQINGQSKGAKYFEHAVLSKKGQEKYIAWQNTYISSGSDDIVGVLSSGEDISEKKKLQEQLMQSQKMESVGSLAGGIAHEFNNILAIIIGNNELILDELPDFSLARESSEEIRIAGIRGRDVVKQLLTFSRQDSPVQQIIDLGSTVQESMKLIRSSTPANIEIKLTVAEDIYPIMANPTQINQVILNLCNNAVDAMPNMGGILTVTLSNMDVDDNHARPHPTLHSGQYAKLTVNDNGVGMHEKTLGRVFEPYYTTKEIGKGTGIGLAVVHGIIKRHDGLIIADSHPGKGTTFTIFLPTHSSRHPAKKIKEKNSLPTGDECILYVDDEPSIANLGKIHLESLGYSTEALTDPAEALEMVRSTPEKFDLVITDLAMPKMTGDQLVLEIMKIRQDMPTIICTGYSAKISKMEATALGVSAYIMKPINKSELAENVRKVLNGSKRTDAVRP